MVRVLRERGHSMASSLLLKICVLLALICVFRITFASANFTFSTSNVQSMEFITNATKRLLPESSDGRGILAKNLTSETNTMISTEKKPHHTPPQQTRKRSMKSLVSPEFTMDKFISFMITSNNIINSNTKYPRLDKLTKSFSRLYNSDGMIAISHFWSMWVNVWYFSDSIANIFRAYETRVLNAMDQNQPQPPNPLEDLQQSLDNATNNIAVVSDLIQQLTGMDEFNDDSADQQQAGDRESNAMQTVKRRSLKGVPQDKQHNANECNGTSSYQNYEELGKEEKIYPVRQRVNSRQKKEQRLAVEESRHFFNPVGYSSNPTDKKINRGSLVYAIKESTLITRNRRSKQFVVDKSRKRKSKQNSQTSESALEATSKRFMSIASGRTNLEVERNGNRTKQSNLRFNFGTDRFIYFMARADNVLNSNTNNIQLNRFTSAFINLFDSDGLIAFNTFYTLMSSFLTVVDSVANLFRFNEARARDQIQQQQAASQPDPLGDLQAVLNQTNANLTEIADLVGVLQNGAAARIETASAKFVNGVAPHQLPLEKKNPRSHPSQEGDNHRLRVSPNQASFSHQDSYKSHLTKTPETVTFSSLATKPHSYFASDGWIPITENPQPLVETNRNFYNPVNHGNSHFSRRQHNPHPFPRANQHYKPVGRDITSSYIIHRINHQYSASARRQPVDYSTNATPEGFW